MSHHRLPTTDPVALNELTPTPAGTPTDQAGGTATPGTTTDSGPPSSNENSIIPPSADIAPVSPPPNQNNNQNNNPTNNPTNNPPNNQSNVQNNGTNNQQNNNQNTNNGQANGNGANNSSGQNNNNVQNNTNTQNNPNGQSNTNPNNASQNNNPVSNTDQKPNNTDQKPTNNDPKPNNVVAPNNTTTTQQPTPIPNNNSDNSQSITNQLLTNNATTLSRPPTTNVTNTTSQSVALAPHTDPIQSTPRQSQTTSHRPQQAAHNESNNNAGTSLGTTMGILVAAVIGAVILAGILAMIKRRKKAKDQSDYHPDLFNEKPYHDPDRQSLESGQGGLPMSPLKPRTDAALFGPRPPSIIENHKASPAIPPPMPSYQPGQVLNYANHPPPQHFNLHRPKPPTYHSPYGDQASDLAYANHPPLDPAPNNGAGQLNPNYPKHGMNHDQSHMGFAEQHGGMMSYPPTTRGELYPNYQGNNQTMMGNPNPAASYSQQQVDQLDFFGHPSPAATMIGSVPADWNSSQSFEKPLSPDYSVTGAGIATGIALTDDQIGTKTSPSVVPNLQQSYLDCYDRPSQDAGYEERANMDINARDPSITNLQQSYLDCHDRASQEAEMRRKEGRHEVRDGIEMDNLGTSHSKMNNRTMDDTKVPGGEGLDWKLASPKMSSPLGDLFDDGLLGPDHAPAGDHNGSAPHILYNERPKQSLKVINH